MVIMSHSQEKLQKVADEINKLMLNTPVCVPYFFPHQFYYPFMHMGIDTHKQQTCTRDNYGCMCICIQLV